MQDEISRFIVRVYGIAFNDTGELLLSDENYAGTHMTKFVGGGLEFGEGLCEGLQREFREECNQEIIPGELFHINGHFQQSAFHPEAQLLSVYYRVRFKEPFRIPSIAPPKPWAEGAQYFRWVNPLEIETSEMTWPIDREVLAKIKQLGLKD